MQSLQWWRLKQFKNQYKVVEKICGTHEGDTFKKPLILYGYFPSQTDCSVQPAEIL